MIVCHCNVLTDRDVRAVVRELLDEDPHRVIVPGLTMRVAGCRGRCCNCFPHLSRLIAETIEEYREALAYGTNQADPEIENEGRPIRHRAA